MRPRIKKPEWLPNPFAKYEKVRFMKISMIVAMSKNLVIGLNNGIPWHLPDDMKYFKKMTVGHHVIMGRRNWESISEKYRPLPDRVNWILTRNTGEFLEANPAPGIFAENDLNKALDLIDMTNGFNPNAEVFIIGGGEIYRLAMPKAQKLYVTEIDAEIDGNVTFPEINKALWNEVSREHHPADSKHKYAFDFVVYERTQ